jgi:hypothetical protein
MDHLEMAHLLWKTHLKPTDFAIDLTCGNGHDTLFLAACLPQGIVFGLDLQPEAIAKTRHQTKGSPNVSLFNLSHPHLPPLPSPPHLAVYNLGYLPGGNKQITTKTDSTLQSLKKVQSVLSENGAISITCYPGHPEGFLEEEGVAFWAKELSSKEWDVSQYRWLNRQKGPSLIWIKRKKTSCVTCFA